MNCRSSFRSSPCVRTCALFFCVTAISAIAGCDLPYRVEVRGARAAQENPEGDGSSVFDPKVLTSVSSRVNLWRARHDQLVRAAKRTTNGRKLPSGRVSDCITQVRAVATAEPALAPASEAAAKEYETLGAHPIGTAAFTVRRLDEIREAFMDAVRAVPARSDAPDADADESETATPSEGR